MARYPAAYWHPLPENKTEPLITATQLIFHSAVSASSSLYNYFSRPEIKVESHFYIREDGKAEQYIDTARQADCNLYANVRALSIESWDNRNPDKTKWNALQMARLIDIALWAHNTHGIPLKRCAEWDSPGMGGHTDFPHHWTPTPSKTCPGLARRPQVDDIIRGALARINGTTVPSSTSVPVKVSSAPNFPLPRGSYFGPKSGPAASVSGYYSHRSDLRTWQSRMGARGWTISADGLYGPATAKVARQFQAEKHLAVDGLIGPATWKAAWETAVS